MKIGNFKLLLAGVCLSTSMDSFTQLRMDSRQIELKLYEWYVKHYTHLDQYDIEKLKQMWEQNKQLQEDPNLVKP